MAPKSRFVGVRFEQEQQRKLILISVQAGEPGNMSAALRWVVDQVDVSGNVKAEMMQVGQRQGEAVSHA